MSKAYLRKSDRNDFIHFIASRGESYPKYVEYAKSRCWPLYSPRYFKVLCQRKRKYIQEARARIFEEIRTVDDYDRKKRIDECESSIQFIDDMLGDPIKGTHQCSYCDMPHAIKDETVIRLLEQKRKFLEQIAKERNEWGKETKEDDSRRGRKALRDLFMETLPEAQETQVSNGKVIVVRDQGSL